MLPDWLSSGQDLFGTLQIIRGKQIDQGYLEVDFDFRFSDTFNYPIIFNIRSMNGDIEAYAISFRIRDEKDVAERVIDERFIAPKVASILTINDFIGFFADVVQKDIDFALYINKTPEKFKKLNVYQLNPKQRIVFNEHFIMAITEVLDRRLQV
jgi:hypothetical protein